MRTIELGRLAAADGSTTTVGLEDNVSTLYVFNGLTAPIYITWGETPQDPRPATATDWDAVVPGSAIGVVPVPAEVQTGRLTVDYAGAVPAADLQAVILGSSCAWAPSTSLLDS